jgi:hypothetical protein
MLPFGTFPLASLSQTTNNEAPRSGNQKSLFADWFPLIFGVGFQISPFYLEISQEKLIPNFPKSREG